MQTIGYINTGNHGEIKILVRPVKYGRSLKLRKTGQKGTNFVDEGIFLTLPENEYLLAKLLNGEVIRI